MHQVERAQHTIKAGEHAQVSLGEVEVGFAEVLGVKPGVHVALKRQQRLLGVGRIERSLPAAEACSVKTGEFVREVHQFGDLRRSEVAQLLDQVLSVIEVFGLGKARGRRRRLVIEGLGWGNHHQHKLCS